MNGELMGAGPSLLSRLRQVPLNLREHGVTGAVEYYGDRLYEAWCDRRLGVATGGYVQASALGFTGRFSECVDYAPTSYRCLDRIFDYLQPHQHDVFLDYGCGLGRVLVRAALQPMRMVIGVELSPELARQARRNIERASPHLRCRTVYVHTGDAAEFEVSPSVSIVFLFNPFRGRILEQVLQRLFNAASVSGMRMRIVYLYPAAGGSLLDGLPWLRRVAELTVPRCQRDMKLVVYETVIIPRDDYLRA